MSQFAARSVKLVCFFTVLAALTACSKLGVKPWQKGTLAKESMSLEHSRLQSAFDDHIYYARESSTGGGGLGGGGCGCN